MPTVADLWQNTKDAAYGTGMLTYHTPRYATRNALGKDSERDPMISDCNDGGMLAGLGVGNMICQAGKGIASAGAGAREAFGGLSKTLQSTSHVLWAVFALAIVLLIGYLIVKFSAFV